MSDQGFPVIRYCRDDAPREWGRQHGETYRDGIAELVQIRRDLMHEKNPRLTAALIAELAQQQWQCTADYDASLTEELTGICDGAGLTIEEVVILNNYTDFRDIQVLDQGCSVVAINYDQFPIVGQTWDMHGSAKNYVCCMEVPQAGFEEPAVLFSIVGCVGMMGFHPRGAMVGVNNINTDGARAGALWPCVIRRTLEKSTHQQMRQELAEAPITSGHCYLLATLQQMEFWEVMPGLAEKVSQLSMAEEGFLFHTNHCLGPQAQLRETKGAANSTTHIRYELIEKKIHRLRTLQDVCDLMNDHENYPKSICSNFQTDSQDPSITCGGAAGELTTGVVRMWRGDPLHDDNYCCREFQLGAANLA